MEIDRLFATWSVIPICECLCRMKVVDTVPADGSAMAVSEIAEKTGLDADLLYRFMRLTAGAGVFAELEGRRFSHNDSSRRLITGGDMYLKIGTNCGPDVHRLLANLDKQLKDPSKSAFQHEFNENLFTYWQRNEYWFKLAENFMTDRTIRQAPTLIKAFDELVDKDAKLLVDLGGGVGRFALGACQVRPGLRAVVFEMPAVAELGREMQQNATGFFGEVDDSVRSRLSFVGGDFFKCDDVRKASDADVLYFKNVLHDWPDHLCSLILENVYKAMKPTAQVVICESVLPESFELKDLYAIDFAIGTFVCGKERKKEDWLNLIPADKFSVTFSRELMDYDYLTYIILRKK